eukprot:363638_1
MLSVCLCCFVCVTGIYVYKSTQRNIELSKHVSVSVNDVDKLKMNAISVRTQSSVGFGTNETNTIAEPHSPDAKTNNNNNTDEGDIEVIDSDIELGVIHAS